MQLGIHTRYIPHKQKEPGKVTFHKALKGFSIQTKQTNIIQVKIVPRNGLYEVKTVYEKQLKTPDTTNLKYLAGIDIGIDNFSTITVWNNTSKPLILNGKGLKSYNKYFNKILADLKSKAETENHKKTTRRIKELYQKRNNYMQTWMHQASKQTVDYLLENQVSIVAIGSNKDWKHKSQLSKEVNQTFIQIPYKKYIEYLTYKAREVGIKVIQVNEAYTSGTSFLDNEEPTKANYNKNRRKHRGLFISNTGTPINADVNASYQMMKRYSKQPLTIDFSKLTKKQLNNKITPQRVNVS